MRRIVRVGGAVGVVILLLSGVMSYAQTDAASEETGTEAAFPLDAEWSPRIVTLLLDGGTKSLEVPYAVVNNTAVYEGDIVLGSELEVLELNLKPLPADNEPDPDGARGLAVRAGFGGVARRWQHKTIPYVLPENFPGKKRVVDAIAHWNGKTVIKLVPRTTETDYVTFREASGQYSCSSNAVGRTGGQQFVNLGASCPTGSVIHEIGHVVGLGHEHTRADRNSNIYVDYSNIQQQFWSQYQQNSTKYEDTGPYDFGSIMHYGAKGNFNINGNKPSIYALNGHPSFGQRMGLSQGDIDAVAKMYQNVM